ncbi:Uncharacterised protein [Chlamydia trachomatis]|nr:Uncharacterised protein [Chlamydia trachomatis]
MVSNNIPILIVFLNNRAIYLDVCIFLCSKQRHCAHRWWAVPKAKHIWELRWDSREIRLFEAIL